MAGADGSGRGDHFGMGFLRARHQARGAGKVLEVGVFNAVVAGRIRPKGQSSRIANFDQLRPHLPNAEGGSTDSPLPQMPEFQVPQIDPFTYRSPEISVEGSGNTNTVNNANRPSAGGTGSEKNPLPVRKTGVSRSFLDRR